MMKVAQSSPRFRQLAIAFLALTSHVWLSACCSSAAIVQEKPTPRTRNFKIKKDALEREIVETVEPLGNNVRVSLWLGGNAGPAWFETMGSVSLPTASAIKAFYLVELFSSHSGKLDEELTEARPILSNDKHLAISHFTATQREDIRRELGGASVRRIGEVMIGKAKASNHVYNAAANITTAVLGGPEALTAAIQKRDPAFKDVTVRRYMLRDRKKPGDNEATAAAFAVLYQRLATGKLAGIDKGTMKAIREVLRSSDDAKLGSRFSKGGNLESDPLTEVRAGWWETKAGNIVYVVMTSQPTPGTKSRKEAAEQLRKAATRLESLIVTAGRKALGT